MVEPTHRQQVAAQKASLTDPEKNFATNFWYETLDLKRGPAMKWLRENRIEEREIAPFTVLFQREFGLNGAPRPGHCDIPWSSAEAFRARSEELRPLMDQPLRVTETPS
jgi:hypothetical protein